MRKAGLFSIFVMALLPLLFVIPKAVWAQSTDEEIKLVKEQIEQLNQRLEELEAKKSRELHETKVKSKSSTPDPVTFLNSAGAGTNKQSQAVTSRTLFTGSGTVDLTGKADPRKFNAVLSPIFHRQLLNNLHLIVKPEIKLEQDQVGFGLGAGEVDYYLTDYMTLSGGKLVSPFSLISKNTYPDLSSITQYLPTLYPSGEEKPSQDLLSDLRNMGVGVSGGIPVRFFDGTRIKYSISYVNGINGPGIMNFSFTISQKE